MLRAFQSTASTIVQKGYFKMVIPVPAHMNIHVVHFEKEYNTIVVSGTMPEPPAVPKNVIADLEEVKQPKKNYTA